MLDIAQICEGSNLYTIVYLSMWLTLYAGWALPDQKEAVHITHVAYREDSLPSDEKDDIHQSYLLDGCPGTGSKWMVLL